MAQTSAKRAYTDHNARPPAAPRSVATGRGDPAASGGRYASARPIATSEIGTLTRNTARQPATAPRKLPSTGPSAALALLETVSAPSHAAGTRPPRPPPATHAPRAATPAGNPTDVPSAWTARTATRGANDGTAAAATPVAPAIASPATSTRREPTRSASQPARGWATADARANDSSNKDAEAGPTRRSDRTAAIATAIMEEFSGLGAVAPATLPPAPLCDRDG